MCNNLGKSLFKKDAVVGMLNGGMGLNCTSSDIKRCWISRGPAFGMLRYPFGENLIFRSAKCWHEWAKYFKHFTVQSIGFVSLGYETIRRLRSWGHAAAMVCNAESSKPSRVYPPSITNRSRHEHDRRGAMAEKVMDGGGISGSSYSMYVQMLNAVRHCVKRSCLKSICNPSNGGADRVPCSRCAFQSIEMWIFSAQFANMYSWMKRAAEET